MVQVEAIENFQAANADESVTTSVFSEKATPNQFFTLFDKRVTAWDIYTHNKNVNRGGFVSYFSKVLQTVDQALCNQGLVFYITMSDMEELPSYGKHVFVLILGDEYYRLPAYVNKVGGIFKCYGVHQIRDQWKLYRPLLRPSYFKMLMLGQSLKNLGHRLSRKVTYNFRQLNSLLSGQGWIAPMFDIPPGYFNSENLPVVEPEDRKYDLFFDGSVIHHQYPVWSIRYWSKTPKAHAREQMVLNLEAFKTKHPQFNIQLKVNSGFAGGGNSEEQNSYSQNLMNAKVCLAPRGTTLETYRLFEAMRYGCIIIAESLPERWFYSGAPILQIGSWDNLEPVLAALLRDPVRLQTLHKQTLDWWEKHCCEKAVGEYIAAQINSLRLSFPSE